MLGLVTNFIIILLTSIGNVLKLLLCIIIPSSFLRYSIIQITIGLLAIAIAVYYVSLQGIEFATITLNTIMSFCFVYLILFAICFVYKNQMCYEHYFAIKSNITDILYSTPVVIPQNIDTLDLMQLKISEIIIKTINIIIILITSLPSLIEFVLNIINDLISPMGVLITLITYLALILVVFKFCIGPVMIYMQEMLWIIVIGFAMYSMIVSICVIVNPVKTKEYNGCIIGLELISSMIPKELKNYTGQKAIELKQQIESSDNPISTSTAIESEIKS